MKLDKFLKKDVKWIGPDVTLRKAAQTMREARVGFLPILSPDKNVLGVLTDRDITVRAVAEGLNADVRVEDVMTRDIETCDVDDDIENIAKRMQRKKVRRIIAVDRDRHLAGVVSLTDIAATSKDPKILGETVKHINPLQ
jgi:CBS domain-containing protein